MNDRYDPAVIEPKWQAFWEKDKTFATDPDPKKKKAYVLDMFPYPSGAGLHVGHPEGYTATDIVCRYLRANGHAVLHPMGWDAFGLPAEQHAIKTGEPPAVNTQKNIDTFRRQIKALGLSYDWDREVDTTDPAYVKWTQWIFLQLYKRGLAYQSEVPVNWCPALGTVLANEEVKDGKSERGDFPVYRMPLRQWMLRITAYSDRLLEDLKLVEWPEGTRVMQIEWIGRSEGAEVKFAVQGHADASIEVFTTRPDTLFGASFMVLAPEHALVEKIATPDRIEAVRAYKERASRRSERDRREDKVKTGIPTGAFAINPVNGQAIPIWIADYVLGGYGTGAIMAVPGHDERDFEFAKKFDLPITRVVAASPSDAALPLEGPFVDDGVAVNSGAYDGMKTADFKKKITADLTHKGQGKLRVETKLRDWVFSRQRYWGEPFPIYFPVDTSGDPRKGDAHTIRYDQPIAVDESELPLRLPELDDYKPGDDPSGPLARAVDWRFFQKPDASGTLRWYARETNTMPQWAGSCWYYLRFTDPQNPNEAFSKAAADRWLPVDLYVGGAEHAVLHLLYARFWHKVLFDAGLVSTPEPFGKLVHQGMILGEIEHTTYVPVGAEGTGFVSREHVGERLDEAGEEEPFDKRNDGALKPAKVDEADIEKKGGVSVLKSDPSIVVDSRAHKMSKSRGNVVNPDAIIQEYGADSLRLYEMFMGPLEATKPWNTQSIPGVRRFLDRAFNVATRTLSDAPPAPELERALHRAIRKVSEDIVGLRFNTAVSTLMVLVNDLHAIEQPPRRAIEILVLLLHPLAPHLGEELWQVLGHDTSVQRAPWPTFDPALCEEPEVEIPVQVNGKVRGRVKVPTGADEATVVAAAMNEENVRKNLEGKELIKKQYVAGRILTLVVK